MKYMKLYPKSMETENERMLLKEKIENIQKTIKYDFSLERVSSTIINKSEEELENLRAKLLTSDKITEHKTLLYGCECIGKNPGFWDYDWVFPLTSVTFEQVHSFIPRLPEVVLYWTYGDYSVLKKNDAVVHSNIYSRITPKSIEEMLNIIQRNGI